MAPHYSILAWKIPWTDQPSRIQFMGSQRIRHNWSDWAQILYLLLNKQWEEEEIKREIKKKKSWDKSKCRNNIPKLMECSKSNSKNEFCSDKYAHQEKNKELGNS